MARKRRLESSDGLYHVINRGNYRADMRVRDRRGEAIIRDNLERGD